MQRRLAEELFVDSRDSLVSVLRFDKNGGLDLAGRDHLDVDLSVIESLKHLCGNARVAFHTRADDRNLCYVIIIEDLFGADVINITSERLNSFFTSVLCDGKADVLFAVVTDRLCRRDR